MAQGARWRAGPRAPAEDVSGARRSRGRNLEERQRHARQVELAKSRARRYIPQPGEGRPERLGGRHGLAPHPPPASGEGECSRSRRRKRSPPSSGGTSSTRRRSRASIAPGQFVILLLDDHGERIPLTIADLDPPAGTITLVVQEVGKTTMQLSAARKAGDPRPGRAARHADPHRALRQPCVCVGGGIGIAPMLPIARGAEGGRQPGARPSSAARTKDLLILRDEMRARRDEMIITTDDGSFGRKGLVTHALTDLIAERRQDRRGHRDRAGDHDEVRRRPDAAARDPHACARSTRSWSTAPACAAAAASTVGGKTQVRLRRRPRVRRPPGRLRRADEAAAGLPTAKSRSRASSYMRRPRVPRAGGRSRMSDAIRRCPELDQEGPDEDPPAARCRSRTPEARVSNFDEVALGYTAQAAMEEAQRCLDCDKPLCVAGCPVGIDIPAFVDLIRQDDFEGACARSRRPTPCRRSAAASARRRTSARWSAC